VNDDATTRHLQPVPTDGADRTPPSDVLAERALLGLCITTPGLIHGLDVQPSDFYEPRNEWLYTQLFHVAAADVDLTPITVNSALMRQSQDYQRNGGAPYLFEIINDGTSAVPASAPYLAKTLREHSRARRLLELGRRLTQFGHTSRDGGIDQALMDAMDEVEVLVRDQLFGATSIAQYADLTWLLDGQPPHVEPPEWCKRTDGKALFYSGRVNGVFGDPEAAKSWLAQMAIVEALTAGRRAALIDVDHNGQQLTVERLMLLGAHPAHLADPTMFRYLEPDDGQDLRACVAELVAWEPAIAVLDSIGEMMPMLGIKSVDNDELSGALRLIASPLARVGACVITIDHLPKAAEARSTGFAIGGTAKKRAIDGTYLHAEARSQPAPGQVGRITLRIEKDRPGRLRATCIGKYAGTFVLDSTILNVTTTRIELDTPITEEGVFRPTHLMEKASRHIEENPNCTGRDIRDSIRSSPKNVLAAIQCLITEGYVSTLPGPKNSTLHHSIAIYREVEDANA
jgi:hypothetical protein